MYYFVLSYVSSVSRLLYKYNTLHQLDNLEGEKKIGLEATGHYGQNLKQFLENNGFIFMEFNPLLISRFVRRKSLRNTKTDSIDAHNIAQYLMTVEYHSSLKLSRHTLPQLLIGSATSLLICGISLLIYGLG